MSKSIEELREEMIPPDLSLWLFRMPNASASYDSATALPYLGEWEVDIPSEAKVVKCLFVSGAIHIAAMVSPSWVDKHGQWDRKKYAVRSVGDTVPFADIGELVGAIEVHDHVVGVFDVTPDVLEHLNENVEQSLVSMCVARKIKAKIDSLAEDMDDA